MCLNVQRTALELRIYNISDENTGHKFITKMKRYDNITQISVPEKHTDKIFFFSKCKYIFFYVY